MESPIGCIVHVVPPSPLTLGRIFHESKVPVSKLPLVTGYWTAATVAVDVDWTVCVAVWVNVFVVVIVTVPETVEVLGVVTARTQADVT